MTTPQKEEYKKGSSLFYYKLSAVGFTFPAINGEYTLDAFSPELGYYKIGKKYALIFFGPSHTDFNEAKIVSVDSLDDVVAHYNKEYNIWIDYFGDCTPQLIPIEVNLNEI